MGANRKGDEPLADVSLAALGVSGLETGFGAMLGPLDLEGVRHALRHGEGRLVAHKFPCH